jgi:hypothetical protein
MDKDSSSLDSDAAVGDLHRWPDGTGADHLSSCAVYPEISGLDCELFALTDAGLRPDQIAPAEVCKSAELSEVC